MSTSSPFHLISQIKGGIGNQLFQHVFAQSLALRFNAPLALDDSYFKIDTYGRRDVISQLYPDLKPVQLTEFIGPGCYQLQDGQINAWDQPLALPTDLCTLVLSGYWQNSKLLNPVCVEEAHLRLQQHVSTNPQFKLVELIQQHSCAIAVHIRRGDYGHMGLCKPSYYSAALDYLQSRFMGAEFFIFTDEPNYTRHLLKQHRIQAHWIQSGDDLLDLYLMSLCRHFLISNSSYSWWGAFFKESKDTKIICPKEWVTIDNTPSPCSEHWLKISNAIEPFSIDTAEKQDFHTKLMGHERG